MKQMKLSQDEFNDKFKEAQDILLKAMADDPQVDLEKFYSMTCFLENLYFFSPVLYHLMKQKDK